MTICPVALAVGCRKCPVVGVCPVKTVIGDYREEPPASTASQTKKGTSTVSKKRK